MRCSLARGGGHATVRRMRDLLILAIHLLVTVAKLLRPGGVRAVLFVSPRRIPKLGAVVKPATPWWTGNIDDSFPPATVAANPAPKVRRQHSSRRSSR